MIKVRKYDNLMDVGVDVNKKGGKKKTGHLFPHQIYIYTRLLASHKSQLQSTFFFHIDQTLL